MKRAAPNFANPLHGQPEFQVWAGMIQRCTNPKRPAYRHYGGRGIRVCDDWRTSFSAFVRDMGSRPSMDHTIDRVDNDGNYEPGNCRWITQAAQTRNTRSNKLLTVAGRTQCVADWAAEVGISPFTMYDRVRRGWPVEECVFGRGGRKVSP